jgi:hypothetical protein
MRLKSRPAKSTKTGYHVGASVADEASIDRLINKPCRRNSAVIACRTMHTRAERKQECRE